MKSTRASWATTKRESRALLRDAARQYAVAILSDTEVANSAAALEEEAINFAEAHGYIYPSDGKK